MEMIPLNAIFLTIFLLAFSNGVSNETIYCFPTIEDHYCGIPLPTQERTAQECCNVENARGFSNTLSQREYEKAHYYSCEFCEKYEWATWGSWSECSESCNEGKRERIKGCNSTDKKCYGKHLIQQEKCKKKKCPNETSNNTSVIIIACLGTTFGVLIVVMIVVFCIKKKIFCVKKPSSNDPEFRSLSKSSKLNQYSPNPTGDPELDSYGYLNPSSHRRSDPQDHIYESIPYYSSKEPATDDYYSVYGNTREDTYKVNKKIPVSGYNEYLEMTDQTAAETLWKKHENSAGKDEDDGGYLCMSQGNNDGYLDMRKQPK